MDTTLTIFVALIVAVLIVMVLYLFFNIVFITTEHNYGLIFHKPLFIHLYPNLNKLSTNQFQILKNQFSYYNELDEKKKKYFEHRVSKFIEKYNFIGKDDFIITDEVKVLIASTSVMLTFGMRKYLFDIIESIIVYPSIYYSTISEDYHKGEFNPRMKAIVFSWEDFLEGYQNNQDNLNLGIHEFTHVLHFHGLKNEDASSIIFSRMFNQIQKEVNHPPNKERLINSDYFRIYAYTNPFEFLAVIVEHYFETPKQFKIEFPELYENVSKMLNHKH